MDLGKLLRKQVRAILHPYLAEQGFTEFSDLAAWRKGPRWIDCVQVMTLGATEFGFPKRLVGGGTKAVYANAATFSFELGCYYTDVHLLPWAGPVPERPRCPRGQGPRYPTCHRLRSLARSYGYSDVQGTLYPCADDGSDLDRAVDDALQALEGRGLAWLAMTHDVDAFLARVDQEPAEYTEYRGGPIELSDEERIEFERWKAKHGIEEGEVFAIHAAADPPEFFVRREQAANLLDHPALDSLPPYGDLYYGLLVGSGRREEAMEAMRRDSDPTSLQRRYEDMFVHGIPRREANAMKKRENAYLQVQREHLAMLEALRSGGTSET